ncbi:MATH domain and coiled-coil domain-containing protein [Camellia lanceoleosa]|uniref:MATH domain and coiled-coil domain-containing protein n=1 Tax=Camellia lanceoleosa TaxID=1840588 RepID=A0ACC0FLW7_9ERIC|nr:MATH domain and coiled-coil domain-containing protein [Camellia lanceoleosa]
MNQTFLKPVATNGKCSYFLSIAEISFYIFVEVMHKLILSVVYYTNGKVNRFHGMTTEWGFPQLLSLSTFNDPSNGYLFLDKCLFGAEVFVLNYSGRAEFLSFKELDIIHTWKIENFSSLDAYVISDVFTAESCEWILCLYPKGSSEERDKYLSLYLGLYNGEEFPPERKLYAHYSLCIRNQHNGKHKKFTGGNWFSATSDFTYGDSTLLSLTDLHDSSKGFLVNDTLIVECKVIVVSEVKNFAQ